jgi:uncharacterized damage-inducible protein DinB
MPSASRLRARLEQLLEWGEAHVTFDAAVADLPAELRGRRPEGFPHSPWELVEHVRITQHDLLDFCRNQAYVAPTWPDDYWPPAAAPPTPEGWDESIAAYRADRSALQAFVADPRRELGALVPRGTGEETYLRSVLLVADHTSYHLGQLVAARRLLGDWPPPPQG